VGEPDPILCKQVDVRGFNGALIRIASKGVQALVIGEDDQEIGLLFLFAVA
jgi:hypothetical protein